MRKTASIILLLTLLCSCEPQKQVKPHGTPIRWDVVGVHTPYTKAGTQSQANPQSTSSSSSQSAAQALTQSQVRTKSLISGYDALQHACTPVEDGGLGKAIGFFAESESHGIKDQDVFGSKETRLIYKTKIGSPYQWNYLRHDPVTGDELDDLEWEKTKLYHIRAYYPQSLTSLIEPSSTPRSLVMNYNTHTTQEDLMVAYNRVYTVDTLTNAPSICIAKDPVTGERIDANLTKSEGFTLMPGGRKRYDWCGYDQPFDLSKPIPLFFEHTLAAIRVRFKFNYDVSGSEELYTSDELLNCYFSNSDDYNGLHTTGSLVYGNGTNTVGNSREQLESWWKTFSWKSIQSSMEGVPYYRWGLSEADIEAKVKTGTIISRHSRIVGAQRQVNDRMAVAYTRYPTQDLNEFTRTGDPNDEADGAKSTFVDDSSDPLTMSLKHEAPFFNDNDGWLLIIPQKAVSGLRFNFTTRNMGLVSTPVPPITFTTDADGDQAYLPGYRYTYTLTIEESDIRIDLSIVPWNEIYASEDIVF